MEALSNLFGEEKKRGNRKRKSDKIYKKKLKFDLTKFPSAAVFSFAVLLFAVAGGLLFASKIIPQLNRGAVYESVIESSRKFELTNEVNGGLFSTTDRKGDTIINTYATYMGVSILEGNLQNPKGAKEFAQKLQLGEFDDNLELIHNGVGLLKGLSMLDVNDYGAKSLVDKIYNQILGLQEIDSGFKMTKFRAPTTTATYLALETIEALGKLKEFKAKPEFKSSLEFLLSQQIDTGFADVEGQNATLSVTYYAVKALMYDRDNEEVTKALEAVADFVYACQAVDGGFLNRPAFLYDDLDEQDEPAGPFAESSASMTVEGLETLYALAELGVVNSNVLSQWAQHEARAAAYVRACLKARQGLKTTVGSSLTDLRANHRFVHFVKSYPNFNYGTIAELEYVLIGAAIIVGLYGLFQFYKEQISDEQTFATVSKEVTNVLGLLVASGAVAYFVPRWSILVYLVLFFYVGLRACDYTFTDNTQGEMFLMAATTALIHLIFFILLNSTSAGMFLVQFYFFYVFALWFVVSCLVSSYIFVSTTLNRKPSQYIGAAFIGWALSIIATIIYVSERQVWPVALRLIFINGQFPLVFVVLPFAALFLSYPASLIPLSF